MAPQEPGTTRPDLTLPAPRIPRWVRLRIWGVTGADRDRAELAARADHRLYSYRIMAVEQADEPTPAAGDRRAIASGASYDRTWAAYPVDAGRREAA